MNENLLKDFLSAFIDDEGAVTESSCRIMLKNESLVKELNLLFNKMGFETSEVTASYRKYWYFTIHDIGKIKELPIIHSEKLNLIEFSLKRKKTGQPKGKVKNDIIALLRERPYSSVTLSRILGFNSQTIRHHMRELLKVNKVKYRIIKGIKYWTIRGV